MNYITNKRLIFVIANKEHNIVSLLQNDIGATVFTVASMLIWSSNINSKTNIAVTRYNCCHQIGSSRRAVVSKARVDNVIQKHECDMYTTSTYPKKTTLGYIQKNKIIEKNCGTVSVSIFLVV